MYNHPFVELAEPTLCHHSWNSYIAVHLNGKVARCHLCKATLLISYQEAHETGIYTRTFEPGPEWEPNAWRDAMLGTTGPTPRKETP